MFKKDEGPFPRLAQHTVQEPPSRNPPCVAGLSDDEFEDLKVKIRRLNKAEAIELLDYLATYHGFD